MKTESNIVTLAEFDYATRAAYVDSVVSLAQSATNIGPDLVRRIYQLFAQAEMPTPNRIASLERMFLKKSPPAGFVPEVPNKDIAFSLIKDFLYVGEVSDKNMADKLVQQLITRFGINQDQLAFLRSWTEWENRILEKLGKPGAVVSEEDMPIELAKKGAAVGVPVATLYFSGSVVGLSAAGITSGLTTIGSASGLVMLGLNPMTAGIVVLTVGGIAIKKILDALFPSTREDEQIQAERAELEREARRLQELRRTYVGLLQMDADFFRRGKWWEIFTGRRRRRRMAVQLLRQVAASEGVGLQELAP